MRGHVVSDISEVLAAMVGIRFPGGCADCDAWQEMRRQHGIYVINVCHDEDCPTWRRIQARREATS
jgi:hypothetical protein